MQKSRRGSSLSLGFLLFLFANDFTTSSKLVLDTPTNDASTRPEQEHISGSAVCDWEESCSSVGCSWSEGRDQHLGRKSPNGAAGTTLPSFKSAPARVRGRDVEDSIPDIDLKVTAEITNTLATASAPTFPTLPSPKTVQRAHSEISAVLVLNLQDAHLATLLMTTLRECGGMEIFRDFFVVVPSGELSQIEAILRHATVNDSNDASTGERAPDRTPIVMVDEWELLRTAGVDKMENRWWPYSLQMVLKLLASSLVKTPFYLTLDADVLCTKDGLSEEDLLREGKGNYVSEGREVHPLWWTDAAKTLGVEEKPQDGGFGVTPAVLSTSGAGFVFERLRTVYGGASFLRRILDSSLNEPGGWWTEYTLYRTALDHFGVFDSLHAVGRTKLLGDDSVWYSDQFDAWNVTAAFDVENTAAFVVVQSTAEAGLSGVLRKLGHGLDAGEGDDKQRPTPPRSQSSLRQRIVRRMWSPSLG